MIEINKIHQQDCVEFIKNIDNDSVDCIITDPPYGINYLSNHYKNGNPYKKIENDNQLFIPLDDLWRVLKPTGCMFVFFSYKVPLVDERVKNTIIWVKNNWTAGDLFGDLGNQYESIAYMPKDKFKIKSKRYTNVWNFDRVPSHKLKHPTQKPKEIIRRMIELSTQPGDLVLDPFMGSGTTAVTCKEMSRQWVGCELNQDYIDIANERLCQGTLLNE